VVCADVDAGKIERLNRGEVPIYEPGLDDLITRNEKAGRLKFTTDIEETIRQADVVFCAVGTPPAADGSADLSAVYEVAKTFGRVIDRYKVSSTSHGARRHRRQGPGDRVRAHEACRSRRLEPRVPEGGRGHRATS
jgi:UDPglucose 6-dehydrogenase